MSDLDQGGFGFQRVRTYLGPSLGWVDELVRPTTDITTGGIHVVQPGESLLLVEVAATVTVQLPDVVKWMQQSAGMPATGFDRSITVKDIGGNAANFNIVVAPFGQQTIDNLQQSTLISVARSAVRFVPLLDLTGWVVDTAIGAGGGGGGGGGDVFKAGNNTFTGINAFNSTITVPTLPAGDNSQNAATTAYVQGQGYIISASLAPYALIASPTFTGDPKAPTPTPGDNDTSLATTAFVQNALSAFVGGAPVNAEYITSSGNATLTNERILTNSASITWDFTVPGQAKANTAAGGGNVSNVGTPTNGQLAQWTTSTTIQGINVASLGYATIASPVFTGDPQAPTPATADNDTSIATTAYVKANLANFQPLDADLSAISGLAGTNTIYYRSAPDIWSPVTFSGLSFSGGVLTVTAGGGNVNNSGAPTIDQVAVWTDAIHIKGVAAGTIIPPMGAEYITSTADPTLTAERVLTDTLTITWDRATAGQIKANVVSSGGTSVPQGRLTLQTATAVMTGTQSAKTTIFYTPYQGNLVPIYNGTSFAMTAFTELSALTTDTTKSPAAIGANKVNDWYVWNDAGTIRLGHDVDWTNDTTRVSGHFPQMVNGIWVNNVGITNGPATQRGTYVGTTRSNAASQLDWILGSLASGGGAAFLNVWNAYNRVNVSTIVREQDQSWSPGALGAYRGYNGSAGNRVSMVCGLQEDSVAIQFTGIGSCTTQNTAVLGININSTVLGPLGFEETFMMPVPSGGSSPWTQVVCNLIHQPLGYNFYQAVEYSAAADNFFYGRHSGAILQSGLLFHGRM